MERTLSLIFLFGDPSGESKQNETMVLFVPFLMWFPAP